MPWQLFGLWWGVHGDLRSDTASLDQRRIGLPCLPHYTTLVIIQAATGLKANAFSKKQTPRGDGGILAGRECTDSQDRYLSGAQEPGYKPGSVEGVLHSLAAHQRPRLAGYVHRSLNGSVCS
jgi:hypothetical protein